MAVFENAGWYLASGNTAVFLIACGITLVFGDPSAMIA